MSHTARLPRWSTPRSLKRGLVTLAVVTLAVVASIAVSPGASRTIAAEGDPLGSGGEFQEIDPARIFDTRVRALDVAPFGRKPLRTFSAGQPTVDIPVVGKGGLPAPVDADDDGQDDNVLAVVVNITVIEPTHVGFLRAFGKGGPEEDTSVVNFFPGSVIPNTAIIRPGDDGMMSLRLVGPTTSGSVNIAIDITGWFSTSDYGTRGDRVIAIDPIRVYDSDLAQFGGKTLRGRTQIGVPIRGAAEVSKPSTPVIPGGDDIVGAIVNVTGVNVFGASEPTFISALPTPVASGSPTTSTVNLIRGQVRANMAILPVGPDGKIHLFNLAGEVRMVVDVVAYMRRGDAEDTREGRVVPLRSPFRAFDTREDDHGDQPLGPGQAEDWSFENFADDVRIGTEAVGAQSALIGNLTLTDLQPRLPEFAPALTHMTAYPSPAGDSTTPPVVSNVNIAQGDTVPNLALLRYGTTDDGPYSLRFYNLDGYVDYLLDVYAVILANET